MHWKPIVTSLLFLLIPPVSFLAAQNPPPSIATPRSNLALSDFYAHDPFILADPTTKTYYLYTAIGARQSPNGHAGVVAYKSTDPADGAWAPEVHRYRGKLYLFVTLHNNDKLLDEPVPVTHPMYQADLRAADLKRLIRLSSIRNR
jgi:hypothetical protein